MKEINLSGKKRTEVGKKSSKLLRKEGLIPCNMYGESEQAISFTIAEGELRKAVFTPIIYVCNIDIDGEPHKAVIKEIQQHPVTDAVLHVDFYEINETKPITVGIPVKTTGFAAGVRDGGKLTMSIRKINVTAPYKQIPEELTVDVTELALGKSIKVGSLSFEGLDIATSPEVVVCSVRMTRQARSAATAEEGEEAAE
ncbi:MAG: 50S ribosomal protein L25/general stress protein Ctc [Prevotella sp.]|nr:50S ribosomal protein L25/general stress protein Ctc [Candidatus Equicola faecalis]